MDITKLAIAFTEWDRRFREEPERFDTEWHDATAAEDYGNRAAHYFAGLLDEQ